MKKKKKRGGMGWRVDGGHNLQFKSCSKHMTACFSERYAKFCDDIWIDIVSLYEKG